MPCPHGVCPEPLLHPREAGPGACGEVPAGQQGESLRFQQDARDSSPVRRPGANCVPASSRAPAGAWLLAQGRAGGWTPVAGPGCRRGVRLRRKWVCVHAYLSAGERGYGWPGLELPGSVLPSVLSELALL